MSDLKLCSSFFLTMTLVKLGGALGGVLAFVTRGKKRLEITVAPRPTLSINVIDRQWISVKDQLPEVGIPVLAFDSSKFYVAQLPACEDYCEYWTVPEDYCCSCLGCTGVVTHWMPLPEDPHADK